METSRTELVCQRPRAGCEPGQTNRPKILPEPQSESRPRDLSGTEQRQVGAPGSPPVSIGAGISFHLKVRFRMLVVPE